MVSRECPTNPREASGLDPEAVHDNEQTVVHSEEFVTDDGVHINQVECLWSLVNPWLQKFRGLSSPDWSSPSEPTGSYGR